MIKTTKFVSITVTAETKARHGCHVEYVIRKEAADIGVQDYSLKFQSEEFEMHRPWPATEGLWEESDAVRSPLPRFPQAMHVNWRGEPCREIPGSRSQWSW